MDDVVVDMLGIAIPRIDPGEGSVNPSGIDEDPEVTNEVFDSLLDDSDPIRPTLTKAEC
jgi:hypothetical protein